VIDYDARPASSIVCLYGLRQSAAAYEIRDFLRRNGIPYDWIEVDQDPEACRALGIQGVDDPRLPLCVLPDGRRLESPTVEEVAAGLGLVAPPRLDEYDLAIVGGGPAGLAAAVYAASEGLQAVIVERVAAGGQAGTSSLIENYLGFPNGISGNLLADRAKEQALRFGAELLLARRLVRLRPERGEYAGVLSDGSVVRARAVLMATGVEWRRLEVPGIDQLLGRGVYYGAGPSEAPGYAGAAVAVVGGGNSAGQACLYFSRYARSVTMLVRGEGLSDSLSQYLVDRIATTDNIDVRLRSRVVGVEGEGRLRALAVHEGSGPPGALPVDALFVCIGGTPHTEWAEELPVAREESGYLLTGTDLLDGGRPPAGWTRARQPFPLETSLPGLFAAGDVRYGSMKRCSAAIGEGAMAVALVHRFLAETPGPG
jgi:thioredoxin reductase (NADPH)